MNSARRHSFLDEKRVLVTGAAGTIGSLLIESLLQADATVCAFDSDESGLAELKSKWGTCGQTTTKFRAFAGNIRDVARLDEACGGVDYLFHCAAMKHVDICEYNPIEAAKTNVEGVTNIVTAALNNEVKRVIFTSSDKAVNPQSTMGATKLLGEKLFIAANGAVGDRATRFSVVRFGNILNSRGSVTEIFQQQIERGEPITLTSERMSRFVLTAKNAVELCLFAAEQMKGGEIFLQNMGVAAIRDVATALAEPGQVLQFKEIGRRPAEKEFEELSTEDEAERSFETKNGLVILPEVLENMPMDVLENFRFIEANLQRAKKPLRSDQHSPMSVEAIREFFRNS